MLLLILHSRINHPTTTTTTTASTTTEEATVAAEKAVVAAELPTNSIFGHLESNNDADIRDVC